MLRFLILLNAILWCLSALPKYPLRGYFLSQLAYTVILPLALMRGIESTTYALAYAFLTGVILWKSLWVTKRYASQLPNPAEVTCAATGIALFLGGLTLHGIEHPLGLASWINVSEGTILMGLAFVLGMAAPHWWQVDSGKAQVAMCLCVLWAGLAAWAFGWPMMWHLETWQRLNFVIPPMLVVSSFTWIGWRLRCDGAR